MLQMTHPAEQRSENGLIIILPWSSFVGGGSRSSPEEASSVCSKLDKAAGFDQFASLGWRLTSGQRRRWSHCSSPQWSLELFRSVLHLVWLGLGLHHVCSGVTNQEESLDLFCYLLIPCKFFIFVIALSACISCRLQSPLPLEKRARSLQPLSLRPLRSSFLSTVFCKFGAPILAPKIRDARAEKRSQILLQADRVVLTQTRDNRKRLRTWVACSWQKLQQVCRDDKRDSNGKTTATLPNGSGMGFGICMVSRWISPTSRSFTTQHTLIDAEHSFAFGLASGCCGAINGMGWSDEDKWSHLCL